MIPHEEPPTHGAPRRPWLAAVLSVLTPGVGQLYVGRPRRALGVWASSVVASVLVVVSAALLPGWTGLISIPLVLIVPILSARDAARIARFNPLVPRRWYDRWYVYAGLLVLSGVLWQPFLRSLLIANVLEAYVIPGGSMAPTLLEGDFIFATKLRRPIERGELAVHTAIGQTYVKRIIGLPGDTLAMRQGALSVNGRLVPEPYAQPATGDATFPELDWQRAHLLPSANRDDYHPSLTTWGPLVVSAGSYFLLGDNRPESLDSRLLGFVSVDSVIGSPTVIYYSRDPDGRAPRWSRIGRSVRD
jgi:signal peptidase I